MMYRARRVMQVPGNLMSTDSSKNNLTDTPATEEGASRLYRGFSRLALTLALLFCPLFARGEVAGWNAAPVDAGVMVKKVAVIGQQDERLNGALPMARRQLGKLADIYLGRALRVSFPHPGSLVTTATPVCFPDVVITVAHIYANIGDGNALPLGLRISVPDLERPGEFRDTLRVKDFRASTTGRNFDPDNVPEVRNDFMVLGLNQPLPEDIVPLGLAPFDSISALREPLACERATVNAAYHADLGLLGNVVVSTDADPGSGRITAPGKTPLLTIASKMTPKIPEGERFGDWYLDPLVAFPQHDTHESASGSAVVCPIVSDTTAQPRDYLLGLMVGQMFFEEFPADGTESSKLSPERRSRHRPAINVASFNLSDMYRSIADLKGIPAESLHRHCSPFIDAALQHH